MRFNRHPQADHADTDSVGHLAALHVETGLATLHTKNSAN